MKTRLIAAMALAAVMFSSQAQAACWSANEVSAAKVRDLETMLMVSALRCRTSGHDFLADYNAFVRGSRVTLTRVNDELRGHFATEVGAREALNAYDRYVTTIANRYGAGAGTLNCADFAAITRAARAEGDSYAGLSRLAEAAAVEPSLPGRACPITMALAK